MKEAADSDVGGIRVEGNRVIPLRKANLDYLSEADIECLDQIIEAYGRLPNWGRKKEAHDEAWEEAWQKKGNKDSIAMPIESIARHLENSDDLIDYLCNRDTD